MSDDRTALARMERQNPVSPDAELAPPPGALESILLHERDHSEGRTRQYRPLLVAASVMVAAGLAISALVALNQDEQGRTVATPGSTAERTFSLPPTNPDAAVFPPVGANPGDAATAPMLHFVAYSSPVSSHELLLNLADRAEQQPPARGEGPYEYVTSRGWYLTTHQTTDGLVLRTEIAEINREQWRAEDGSGRVTDTENGVTQSWEVSPQEHPWTRLDTGDESAPVLRDQLLDDGQGRTVQQWFGAFRDTWASQIASPELQSAYLSLLADQNDIEVLGAVNDRVGRPGIAVSTSTGDRKLVLILDESTGALLDYEEIALIPEAAEVPIPLPSTVNYTVWLDTARVGSVGERP
ncbi:hypothetical protein [Rhodococcus maanshanensis]|uniref:CU044_5270 family protein n=1 Tax=Rhodococcus maanshanensis TaxID=183556 RepID=A0A1H7V5B0_9NOCA|nr:hypothetical protein [Rhodococcus maanshanensis]SEM03897.1 hypothetical protein SAMN05444583_12079 [Rhodococcus maanshanensis]